MFGGILGRIANTVHNDVVAPIQRNIVAQSAIHPAIHPALNGIIHAWQAINPNSGANQGAHLQQQANQAYHFTPAFNQLVSAAHPSLNNQAFGPNGELLPQSKPLGESFGTNPFMTNKIQLVKGMKHITPLTMQDALVHEGLHQQWAQASNPQKDQFFQAYNKLMTSNSRDAQNLKSYLTGRVSGYSEAPKAAGHMRLDAGGVPIGNPAYNNIGNFSPQIQNEIHSYIPEYYSHINATNPLTQYYSQFFQPSGAHVPTQNTLSAFGNTVPSIFPGMNNKPDWLMQEQGY